MGLVEALLALGLLVIVPLGLQLHPGVKLAPVLVVPSVVAAALSLDWEPGLTPTLLALPWFVLTAWLAAVASLRWLRSERSVEALPWPAALAYLAVGAGWLVADRLGLEPAGVTQPFVELTAVHFHYAGFTATLLAALVRAHTAERAPRWSALMLAAIVVAPPIVAAGFTIAGVLQVVGAVVLTLGLFGLAGLVLRFIAPSADDNLTKALLIVSAVAVLVPMVLAVQWAIGWNYDTPALSIPDMARTHGVANALGFALCGVLGWQRWGKNATQGGNHD
jgi:hypothetical protein